jgi:hypothetical protein
MIGDYNVSNTLKSEAEPAEKGWGPRAWGGCRDRKPACRRQLVQGRLDLVRTALEDLWDAPIAWDDPPAQIVR